MQTGKSFGEICQLYNIGQETTEPHHSHQNEAERRIQDVKNMSNRILDRTGAPDSLWLRAVCFTCMLLNVLAAKSLAWRTPMEVGFGITPDISAFMMYTFYEPVYYVDPSSDGYPDTKEKLGHWCGPPESCGDALTSWVLTLDTNELIARSVLRSAVPAEINSKNDPVNFRSYFNTEFAFPADQEGSQVNPSVKNEIRLHSLNEELSKLNGQDVGFKIDPARLLGFSFARDTKDNTQRCVVKDVDVENEKVTVGYLTGSQEQSDYNEVINQMNAREEDGDGLWSFKQILDHRPLKGKRNQ